MNDKPFFVTDAASGIPMNDYLINGQRPLGEKECIRRMEPLIRELGNAEWDSNFTVYPEDLLVRPDGMVVWLRPDDHGTQKAVAKGKIHPGFSPIEQYSNKSTTGAWTNVYAMCATLLYCMTGKVPPSPIERMNGETLDWTGVSPSVAAVLEKGLEIKWADRIQSLRDLADKLHAAVNEQSPTAPESAYSSTPKVSVNKQTYQPQYRSAPVQSRENAKDTVIPVNNKPVKREQADAPSGQKNKNIWKIAIPTTVLAVAAVALFFAFRGGLSNIAIRRTSALQSMEAASPADIKQLVPAANSTESTAPEATITYAETKPYVPEPNTPVPQSIVPTGIGQPNSIGGTVSAPGSQGAGTQTGSAGGTVPTPGSQGAGTQTGLTGGTVSTPGSQGSETQTGGSGPTLSGGSQPPANTQTGTDGGMQSTSGSARPETTSDGLVALTGTYGDVEGVRGPINPFYLDKPVTNCGHVRMDLSIEQISGLGFGYFYLYVKDADGNWHHVALFRIEKDQADGKTVTYELDLDGIESFVAIAICPEEKGMDFTRRYYPTFYVDPNCVSEYGTTIQRPSFTPAQSAQPISSAHMVTSTYSNPYANAPGGGDYTPGVYKEDAVITDVIFVKELH